MSVARRHKPAHLPATPSLPAQPLVQFSDDHGQVHAKLPSGESVTVLLYGATVTSWKDSFGMEKLWMSEAAAVDGSKPVRGGIPLVFPIFGPPGEGRGHPETLQLPQHGFARRVRWEFLGKTTSESSSAPSLQATASSLTSSVQLDFGISSRSESFVADGWDKLWPYQFSLIYRVTLARDQLTTALIVRNEGKESFDFQTLMHTYLRVEDYQRMSIRGLKDSPYVDQREKPAVSSVHQDELLTFSSSSEAIDSIFSPVAGASQKLEVLFTPPIEGAEPEVVYELERANLDDVVVWNPGAGASAMSDFQPANGNEQMLCVEAGVARDWKTVNPDEMLEFSQTIALV